MRHLKKGRKLKRTSSHKKALMRNMATSLFEHKRISTTEAKAKELRPYAEHIITKAKKALINEKQGLLPEGQTVDIHNRRMVYKVIRVKAVLQELFDTIAPVVEDRPGGYTRIIKTGQRRGDGSHTAIIELVDFAAPKDGADSFKSKKKSVTRTKRVKKSKETKEVVAEEVAAEEVVDTANEETKTELPADKLTSEEVNEEKVEEVTEEVKEDKPADKKVETPAEEAKADEPVAGDENKTADEDKKD